MKKMIVECSSVYAIDFATVLFSVLDERECEYELYLNDNADTNSEYRKYISRLAIPTLEWELDPHGNLRQIHLPINGINKDQFLAYLEIAINSFDKYFSDNEYQMLFLNNLKIAIEKERIKSGLDCYKKMIQLIIANSCGKNISINNFGNFRSGSNSQKARDFFQLIILNIASLPNGHYKFVKGGRIEFNNDDSCCDNRWIGLRTFKKNGSEVYFFDDLLHPITLSLISNAPYIRFRGPLETAFVGSFGTLIDLPWYLDASFCEDGTKIQGYEYITPISSSSVTRTSLFIGGQGKRLCPAGYSLIDYNSQRILELLNNFYKEPLKIQFSDLKYWKVLEDNYPVTSQKIAKNQSSIHMLSNALLKCGFENREFLGERVVYRNYVLLGNNIMDLCLVFKSLRLVSNSHSPYFRLNELLGFYVNDNCNNMKLLFSDMMSVLSKTRDFFAFMKCSHHMVYVNECMAVLQKNKYFFFSEELPLFDDSTCNRFSAFCSKIEIALRNTLYSYHEIAIFIIGVLLKANIFSGFLVLGDEYADCIRQILQERKDNKYLSFRPIYYEQIRGDKP